MRNSQRKPAYPIASAHEPAAEPPSAARHERYLEAASLLRLWMETKDSSDDEVWPLVAEELEGIRMRCGEK